MGNDPAAASVRSDQLPYVPQPKQARLDVRENGRVLLVGGGVVIVLLILAFGLLSRRQPVRHTSEKNGSAVPVNASAASDVSLTPILDIGPSIGDGKISSAATADQIVRTGKEKPRPSRSSTLANVPPIEEENWQPPPYSADSRSDSISAQSRIAGAEPDKNSHRFAAESLIFVAKSGPTPERQSEQQIPRSRIPSFHLPAGARLRARLESEINSAVKSPVVAIIEDSYEQEGAVLIPAGSRAIGRLVNADKSGYLELQFDSLDMPFGSSLQLEATATDLQLRPLRGRVEGNGTGKNLVVRSAAGIGEIAATLVGRGSLNRPLSEEDMLRERLSNNIGQAGDQQVATMALSQRFVVSVAAGAEIYLVVEKGGTWKTAGQDSQTGTLERHNLDQLRQLLQLQQELNQDSRTQ